MVLDPEEAKVDVIVDGPCAKGFVEGCCFPGIAHGNVCRPVIFNPGCSYVPDEIVTFQYLYCLQQAFRFSVYLVWPASAR